MAKYLVIVESPTKAKTISKFLGSDYQVESSFGHIRDLPKSKIGVDTKKKFKPTYEIPEKSKKQVASLKKAAKGAEEIILATDEDREGEAIAWHLISALNLKDKPISRIVFHEITKDAIQEAIDHPRKVDQNLVDAQQARRILDRLVGYELSPFLWKKVQRGLSAGRVQSVAVRLIVEREREREAFNIEEYWTIDGMFSKDKIEFPGKLHTRDGKNLDKFDLANEADAQKVVKDLADAEYRIADIRKKEVASTPPKPLTTSSLQIEANNKLGYSAKQTMRLAQKLYENGYITYMRTDSMNLSKKFLDEAQVYLKEAFGPEYAKGSKTYATTKKGAQEAHEAIRPTDVGKHPQTLPKKFDEMTKKVYDLIWSRTLATQMPPAKVERTSVDIEAKQYGFRANGSIILFDGFMKVYRSAKEKVLPAIVIGDTVKADSVDPVQHFTEPPARFSDASLVKILEEHGIGRPSTYAPTIETIINRGYVDRDDNRRLYPLDIANIVNDVLVEHFPDVVNYEFTAKMEGSLDDVAEGKIDWVPMLKDFYDPFHDNLEKKSEEIKREDIMTERLVGADPESGLNIYAKNGRFGPFVQLGEWSDEDKKAKINKPKSASLEKGMSLQTITVEEAMKLLELPRTVGKTKEGVEIIANKGRFGAYLKADDVTVTLPEGETPRTITLDRAIELIEEAAAEKIRMNTPLAELGEDPKSKSQILIKTGRFGPYITDGETNVSVKKSEDPAKITREEAIELLEKKRKSPRRGWGGKKSK